LEDYGIPERGDEVKRWYDGYLFGQTEVYNPWSVINYAEEVVHGDTEYPKPYWSNTSSNSIVRDLVEHAEQNQKQQIEQLIADGSLEIPVHEDITYEDMHNTQDNLWNFLFFTGYLRAESTRFDGKQIYVKLKIPNEEIRYIYRHTIMEWFEQRIKSMNLSSLYEAVTAGDEEAFSTEVTKQLGETISFFDYGENYYHGFLAGLLKGCPGYLIRSNRESGQGRYDLVMRTLSVRGMAIIMELKLVKTFSQMEVGCAEALKQIKEKNYEAELQMEGYRKFLTYGICFYQKECLVRRGSIDNLPSDVIS
jgi:hypothetical protein